MKKPVTSSMPETDILPEGYGENLPAVATTGDVGVTMNRVMMMRNFISQEEIIQHLIPQGKGARMAIARIIGLVVGTEEKVNNYQGKDLKSIALLGTFEGTSVVTGEVVTATIVYLPLAYAEHVHVLFKDPDVKTVEVDLDVGVKTTGKTIPYEWTCTSFMEGGQSNVLSRLRNRRSTAPALSAPTAQLQIEG